MYADWVSVLVPHIRLQDCYTPPCRILTSFQEARHPLLFDRSVWGARPSWACLTSYTSCFSFCIWVRIPLKCTVFSVEKGRVNVRLAAERVAVSGNSCHRFSSKAPWHPPVGCGHFSDCDVAVAAGLRPSLSTVRSLAHLPVACQKCRICAWLSISIAQSL